MQSVSNEFHAILKLVVSFEFNETIKSAACISAEKL